jgi:hypothetical protein
MQGAYLVAWRRISTRGEPYVEQSQPSQCRAVRCDRLSDEPGLTGHPDLTTRALGGGRVGVFLIELPREPTWLVGLADGSDAPALQGYRQLHTHGVRAGRGTRCQRDSVADLKPDRVARQSAVETKDVVAPILSARGCPPEAG